MSTTLNQSSSQPRQHWVIGNWKMNPNRATAQTLAQTLASRLVETPLHTCKTAIAPMSIHLITIHEILMKVHTSPISLVAQDIAAARQTGAFTGDISADLIRETGAEWIIIGHSERRTIHHEDENLIGLKLNAALDAGLGVIWCVGETLSEREAGQATQVVSAQINAHIDILTKIDPRKLIIAYEPVWAIGTGRTASPEDAQQMHAAIRQLLTEIRAPLIQTSLLYGGSVKSDNAHSLAKCPDIDGALVGGASLDADSFLQIAKAFDIA
ncbi:MAG: triose-phosphate isomerase [Gammaproteobacteria bacterium]|nr:triose-phosphate isomerase [Gammaproteobacteria bacterium]